MLEHWLPFPAGGVEPPAIVGVNTRISTSVRGFLEHSIRFLSEILFRQLYLYISAFFIIKYLSFKRGEFLFWRIPKLQTLVLRAGFCFSREKPDFSVFASAGWALSEQLFSGVPEGVSGGTRAVQGSPVEPEQPRGFR